MLMEIPPKRACLPRSFYDQHTVSVACDLLGKVLIRRSLGKWLGGIIVETEAYLSSGDLASHSARGRTPSNAAMFGRAGTLYVYPIHAKYCMNVVTEPVGKGSAILIRALEPVWGIDQMMKHRGTDQLRQLTRGPGMLCQALGVDRSQDQTDLVGSDEIRIAEGARQGFRTITTPRIGVSNAAELALRFFVDGNWFVSGRAKDHQVRPARNQILSW